MVVRWSRASETKHFTSNWHSGDDAYALPRKGGLYLLDFLAVRVRRSRSELFTTGCVVGGADEKKSGTGKTKITGKCLLCVWFLFGFLLLPPSSASRAVD